jgi:hypothetical protein
MDESQLNDDQPEEGVDLTFFVDDFEVPKGRPFTPEVERYLVRKNNEEGGLLITWQYTGNRIYRFTFCKESLIGGQDMNVDTQGFTVTPWQVFTWSDPSVNIFIPQGYDFRTVRLAEEYELMAAGDQIEIIRMGDMRILGEAEVISTKRTIIKYLEEADIKDFRRVIGGRENKEDIVTLLSRYHETHLSAKTTVIIMHLRALTSIMSSEDDGGSDLVSTQSVGSVIKSSLTKPMIKGI